MSLPCQLLLDLLLNGANWLAFAQLVAAGVTAAATIALWRVTQVLAVETKTLAAMSSRPFVVCSLESSDAEPTFLNLTLRNTGNATAFDVKLELAPALVGFDGNPPQASAIREVSLLPPDQTLPLQGVRGQDVDGTIYSANISWGVVPNASARESISYKFQPTDGMRGGFRTHGLHKIASEIEKIRKVLPKK